MLLFPKKTKFSRIFTTKNVTGYCGKNHNNSLKFYHIGIITKESGFISNFEIESIRLLFRRFSKKRAQVFFRIFPNQTITKKPNEVRLGRGKGNFQYWSFFVRENMVLCEISGHDRKFLTNILTMVKRKLKIKNFISNKQIR